MAAGVPNFSPVAPSLLDAGIPAYFLKGKNEYAVRLDFHFRAGGSLGQNPALAAAANSLFSESTDKLNSDLMAELLDCKGVFLDRECGKDFSRFTVFCLKHNLSEVLEIMQELFVHPGFAQNDLEIYVNQKIQKTKVNMERNSWLAGKTFLSKLFTEIHPYGRTSEISDYENLESIAVRSFYNNHYFNSDSFLIASGAVSDDLTESLGNIIPQAKKSDSDATKSFLNLSDKNKGEMFQIEGPNKQQVALKMGGLTISRNHPDFAGLSLLYTLLGGYFGSRLMKNIREEKGLTYGISSGILHFEQASYWTIQSDIKSGSESLVLSEIQREMNLLKNVPVSESELTTVKNYLMGVYARLFDGVFSKAERLALMVNHQLPADYYSGLVNKMKALSAQDLMVLANQYFKENETITVLVG